jgi:TRAP transporter TAXI family solute receptor
MRKGMLLSMVLVLVLSASASLHAATQFNWAAAGIGGTYYPISVGMSNVINKNVPDVKITVEITGGGVANARLVGTGDNDLGIANANSVYFAYKGMPPYKQAYKFYSIAYLYPSSLHIIVPGNSSIKSVKDFKGKKLAVGPAGGGTINTLRDILPFYGLEEKDMRMSFISFSDGAKALRDGTVDVNMIIAGAPAAAAKELAETANVRFISVGDDVLKKLHEKYQYYTRSVFPKSMFKTSEDVVTVGLGNEWIVRDGISDDLVYKMTKAVFEHLEDIGKAHPQGRDIKLETATMVAIPLHPGAIKYYKEKGVLK